MAKNLWQKGTLTEPVNLLQHNGVENLYNPAVLSPLYSILAAPLFGLTGSVMVTQYALAVLGWVLFFGGLYKVAQVFFRQQWLVNLFVLFTGLFLYTHQLSEGPKDTLATAFTLWSVYFAYRFWVDAKVANTLLLAFSIVLIIATKHLYLPLAFAFLSTLLLLSVKSKGHLIQYLLLVTFFFVIAGGAYYAFIHTAAMLGKSYSGLFYEGVAEPNGFHPQNWRYAFPFISSSFINTTFWGVQIQSLLQIPFAATINALQILDILLLSCLIYAAVRNRHYIYRHKAVLLLFVLSATLAVSVYVVSLYYGALVYKTAGTVFTFVSEARSFLFPVLCLQMAAFLLLFKQKFFSPFLKKTILLLAAFASLHGFYFTVKQTTNAQKLRAENTLNSAVKKITNQALEMQQRDSSLQLVTTDNLLRRYAVLHNVSARAMINGTAAQLKKGTVYLIATPAADSSLINKIFALQHRTLLDTIHPFAMQVYRVE